MKHRTRLISVYIILALLGTVATGQGPKGSKDTGATSRRARNSTRFQTRWRKAMPPPYRSPALQVRSNLGEPMPSSVRTICKRASVLQKDGMWTSGREKWDITRRFIDR
jgi:hypothetical protein